MHERRLSAVVLAAGEGTRMRSERPKPLHLLCGRPMILHLLDAMAEVDVTRVVVAVGLTGLPDDDDEEEDVVVLPGDTPLLRPQTLAALVRYHRSEEAGATLLTAEVEDPR